MIPVLLASVVGQAPRPGAISQLAQGELAVVSEGGGHLAYEGHLAVRRDGTVVYASSMRGQPARTVRWRLTRPELGAFRALIAQTDFRALHAVPRTQYSPSMADGIDRGLAVRQGKAVRGWTNTVWTQPEIPVPLFERFNDLIAHSRELAGG